MTDPSAPNSEREAGDMDRYAYSLLTDTWYRVSEWEDLGDGKIQAKGKVEVPREEVPQEWLDATVERGDR